MNQTEKVILTLLGLVGAVALGFTASLVYQARSQPPLPTSVAKVVATETLAATTAAESPTSAGVTNTSVFITLNPNQTDTPTLTVTPVLAVASDTPVGLDT